MAMTVDYSYVIILQVYSGRLQKYRTPQAKPTHCQNIWNKTGK